MKTETRTKKSLKEARQLAAKEHISEGFTITINLDTSDEC